MLESRNLKFDIYSRSSIIIIIIVITWLAIYVIVIIELWLSYKSKFLTTFLCGFNLKMCVGESLDVSEKILLFNSAFKLISRSCLELLA